MTTLTLLIACTSEPNAPLDTSEADTAPADTADTGAASPTMEAIALAIRRAARADLRVATATGASVAVWKDGAIVFAEGFGTRDPDGDVPVTTDTVFQIGSDTKKLVAITALQQVARGRMALDDSLAEHVPALTLADDPSLPGRVTLHQLLSHQAGFYDYTPWVEAPEDADLRRRAEGRFAANGFGLYAPGAAWNYSNANFALAGLMVEGADGRPWGDIVTEDVFAPLGMTRTFARRDEALREEDVAIGVGLDVRYDTFDALAPLDYEFGTVPLERTWDCGFTRPAGLVWSTASDMARLAALLVGGDADVLPDALRATITTPHVSMNASTDALGYGYGLMVNTAGWSGLEGFHPGVTLWAHGGNTMSMTSTFFVLPDARIAVSVLSNGYGDDFAKTAVTALEALADLPTEAEAPEFMAPPERVAELAGSWDDPHTLGRLTLTWDGSDLRVEAPDLVAAGLEVGPTLVPVARDTYTLRLDGGAFDLRVARDDDGGVWLVNRLAAWERSRTHAVRGAPRRLDPAALRERLRAATLAPAALERRRAAADLVGLRR